MKAGKSVAQSDSAHGLATKNSFPGPYVNLALARERKRTPRDKADSRQCRVQSEARIPETIHPTR